MANLLDAAAAIPAVECPVEPDEASCMTQVAVDPQRVLRQPANATATRYYSAVSNTLVFTSPRGRDFTKMATADHTPLNDFSRLLPVVGTFEPGNDLSVVGIAYDGVESAEAAKHHPDAKGRLVVQVTGTATCSIHPLDLQNLKVGDLLALEGSMYNGGLVGMPEVKLPKIVVYQTDARARLLRLLIERADGNIPAIPPFPLAVGICSLHRDYDKFGNVWNTDCVPFCKEREQITDKELSNSLEDPVQAKVKAVLENTIDAFNGAAADGYKVGLDVARIVASVYTSVDDLDYLHTLVRDNVAALNDKVEFRKLLEGKVALDQPFGLLLEPGYNQARILLKPGVRL